MSAILNDTQLWFCDIFDKTVTFTSRLRHFHSIIHIHKKQYSIFVKEYDFNNPDFDEANFILNVTIKNCKKNLFIQLNTDMYMILIF